MTDGSIVWNTKNMNCQVFDLDLTISTFGYEN